MKRKALAVAGATAVATVMIGGAALAAAGDDDPVRGRPATVAVTDSLSPGDTPSPTDTASPDDSPTDSPTGSPDDSPTTTAPAQPGGAVVPSDLAAAAALARVGGGTVTSIESEYEHGRAVWKVRIVKDGVRYDLHVDKETGAITRFENKGSESRGGGDDHNGDDHNGDDNSGDDNSGDDNSGSGNSGSGKSGRHGGGGHGSDD